MKRKCPLCGVMQNLTKLVGKDSFGKKTHWYTSDHRCPKLAGSQKLMGEIERGLSL